MKFTVKQKIMAFGKQYRAFDESENQVYEISSMLFSPERRKEVLDMGGSLVAWSEWPIMSGQAKLEAGNESCMLDIPFIGLTPEWSGDCGGAGIEVSGDFMRLSFTVQKAGSQVATIDKRIFAFGDTYEVDVDESAFPREFALLIVALIDHKYHSDEGR
jgi:uncharacterized protein YxjI